MLSNHGIGEDPSESLGLQGSSQSINPKGNQHWLEGLMLKLMLKYFGHLMQRADSLEKTLMMGKIEGRRRRRQQRWDDEEWHHQLLELTQNSCPSSQWCNATISSSVVPFSSCHQSFPALRSVLRSQFFTSCGQSTGVSASASVLPMDIQSWFCGLIFQ